MKRIEVEKRIEAEISLMKKIFVHVGIYIFRGLLAIIPLGLCVIAVRLLYFLIDKQLLKFFDHFIHIRQIPGLGILLLLFSLYLIGLIFGNVLGRQILKVIDSAAERIPIIKAIYGVGKQISESLSINDPQKQIFNKAVLIDSFDGKGWMFGFVTGTIKDHQGLDLVKVFVPTAPHPLTGIIFMMQPSQILDCNWSVEEALKMIVSVGIISPLEIKKEPRA